MNVLLLLRPRLCSAAGVLYCLFDYQRLTKIIKFLLNTFVWVLSFSICWILVTSFWYSGHHFSLPYVFLYLFFSFHFFPFFSFFNFFSFFFFLAIKCICSNPYIKSTMEYSLYKISLLFRHIHLISSTFPYFFTYNTTYIYFFYLNT